MSFDEEPDGDPHGECAAHIADLERQLAELRAILKDQGEGLVRAGELLDKEDAIIAELARRLMDAMLTQTA